MPSELAFRVPRKVGLGDQVGSRMSLATPTLLQSVRYTAKPTAPSVGSFHTYVILVLLVINPEVKPEF